MRFLPFWFFMFAFACSSRELVYERLGATACGVPDASGTGGAGTGGAVGAGGAGTGGAVGAGGAGTGGAMGAGGAPTSDSFCGDAVDTTPLVVGVWKDRSPKLIGFTQTSGSTQVMAFGIEACASVPSTVYLAVSAYPVTRGLCRSEDSGIHWSRVGPLDAPLDVKVDPADSNHVYAVQGVNGASSNYGFWEATDARNPATWVHRHFNVGPEDAYHIAVDPTDFRHVLVSFHYLWGGYNGSAGIEESFNGGVTWIEHPPIAGTGYGHAIHFLYSPALGIGNASTWLLGTQAAGFWRTTNSGSTWTKVTPTGDQFNQAHGGGELYYAANGSVLTGAYYGAIISSNNGVTWSQVTGQNAQQTFAVFGDGTRMFSTSAFGGPVKTALETSPASWSNYSSQVIEGASFDWTKLGAHTIMGSFWLFKSGVWALQIQ